MFVLFQFVMAESAGPSQDQLEASAQSVGAFQERGVDIGTLEDVDSNAKSTTGTLKKETKIIQDGEYSTNWDNPEQTPRDQCSSMLLV